MGTTRRGWTTPVNRSSETDDSWIREPRNLDLDDLPDPYADEPKWAAWKVTLGVVLFCAAFWGGVFYLATRLLG
ncbi:MAG: hypothetical protein QM773_11770 [Hyphomonadaceae bacterium]